MSEQNTHIITNGVKRFHISIVNNDPIVDFLYLFDRNNNHFYNCILNKEGHIKYNDIDINIYFFNKEYPTKVVLNKYGHLSMLDLANIVICLNLNFGKSLNVMRNIKYWSWIEETADGNNNNGFWKIKW